MSRRLVLLASLMLLGLSGCVTMNDGYYREGYYSDGGYYYPAEDGYGDYYQGPEDIDYRYYDSYSYSPFWRLDRYACGGYYSCSPYWNSYYGRPYSGWSLSFGNHWNYGSWGWYGRQWTPWSDGRDYWRHPRHPRRPDPDVDASGNTGYVPPPGVLTPDVSGEDAIQRARRGERGLGGIYGYDTNVPGRVRPGGDGVDGGAGPRGRRPVPGQDVMPVGPDGEAYVRPQPGSEFRGRPGRQPLPGPDGDPSGGVSAPSPTAEPAAPRPDYRGYRGGPSGGEPQPREMPRYQRPEPREMPRYERVEPREMPRYERAEPREMPRYERPEPREMPRYERPEPREAPRAERPEPREAPRYEAPPQREMPTASQNEPSTREE